MARMNYSTKRDRTPEQIEREKVAQAANKAAQKERDERRKVAMDDQARFDATVPEMQAALVLMAHEAAKVEDVEQSYRLDEREAYRFQWDIEKIGEDIESAKAVLAKFTAAINEGDMSRFEWADGAFKAAAVVQIYPRVLAALKRYGRIKEIRQSAIQELLRYASSFSRSTSPSHNLMQDALRSTWADMFGSFGVLGSLYEKD